MIDDCYDLHSPANALALLWLPVGSLDRAFDLSCGRSGRTVNALLRQTLKMAPEKKRELNAHARYFSVGQISPTLLQPTLQYPAPVLGA